MTPYYSDEQVTLHLGDALEVSSGMDDGTANCIVTSPPYFGLRDYEVEGQYGLEASPAEYVETMRGLFSELRRVLADDGTLWVNIGDSYASDSKWGGSTGGKHSSALHGHSGIGRGKRATGLPDKNLIGMPWRAAFALQDDGWILRNAIIWNKPNAMPESVTDRLSTRYEHVFLFSKSRRYWFDLDPIREPLLHPDRITGHMFGGVNKAPKLTQGSAARRTGSTYDAAPSGGRSPGDVWTMPTQPFPGAHFACFPLQLPQRCILAGCKPGGTVLDPFNGSGTTGLAALRTGRKYVGVDINREYLDLTLSNRLAQSTLDFGSAS